MYSNIFTVNKIGLCGSEITTKLFYILQCTVSQYGDRKW